MLHVNSNVGRYLYTSQEAKNYVALLLKIAKTDEKIAVTSKVYFSYVVHCRDAMKVKKTNFLDYFPRIWHLDFFICIPIYGMVFW